MITGDELVALVELINRCPMTLAEKLFVQSLVLRIEQQIVKPENPAEEEKKT